MLSRTHYNICTTLWNIHDEHFLSCHSSKRFFTNTTIPNSIQFKNLQNNGISVIDEFCIEITTFIMHNIHIYFGIGFLFSRCFISLHFANLFDLSFDWHSITLGIIPWIIDISSFGFINVHLMQINSEMAFKIYK